jgi:hypothetical protein
MDRAYSVALAVEQEEPEREEELAARNRRGSDTAKVGVGWGSASEG